MSREVHAGICESRRVKLPPATRRAPRAQEGEADVDRVLLMRVTVQEMEVGPPEPLCRGWFQTTACCVG